MRRGGKADDALVPVRFEGGKYGLAIKRGGKLIRLHRWFRLLDNEDRRRAFRWRQAELILASSPWLVAGVTGFPWALALAALLITIARDEVLRFRSPGQTVQTRRALWVGANPHDRANRHLLNGWTP